MRSKLFRDAKFDYMAILCYLSGFYYYLSSFVVILLPLHTLYLLATPEKSSLFNTLFFLPNVIYLILTYTTFYYPRFSFSVLGNQFFYYWTYMFVALKEFIFGKKEGWVATGASQSKSNTYKVLLVAIFIYIIFYWFWFISIVLNNKFVFAASDYLLVLWIAYNMIGHVSFVVGLIVLALSKPKAPKEFKIPLINLAQTN